MAVLREAALRAAPAKRLARHVARKKRLGVADEPRL